MRQLLIRGLLPILFALLPILGAGLVLMCIPHRALSYFWDHAGLMEGLILIGGCLLFLIQMILCYRALRWQGTNFDETSDRWISNLAQAAECFPMLGLIGTVAGILEAFKVSGETAGAIQPSIIAPAITATGSGLFMALINILPAWVVLLGRDLILTLSGIAPKRPEEPDMIKMPRRNVTRFFIPLIDVLLLLFCIFLLLEYDSESKIDQQSAEIELQASLDARNIQILLERGKEFEKYEKLMPQLTELQKLRDEVERLRGANQQNLQDRTLVRIIDINANDGSISWYDENNADMPVYKLTDAKAAQKLIERHRQEAKGRELYYYFMPPRPLQGYPTLKQMRTYREWFASTANSLGEKR